MISTTMATRNRALKERMMMMKTILRYLTISPNSGQTIVEQEITDERARERESLAFWFNQS